jgi:hypothetical protein
MTENVAETKLKCLEEGCFTGDTLVVTKNGLKRIDEIIEGELVLSKDVNTGEIDYKRVSTVYIKSSTEFIHLSIEDEEIKTTKPHLFFTEEGWWKSAENLNVGDKIINSKGELKTLISKTEENLSEPERIYNLNVEDYHTYYVGSQGLLVHNNCTEKMADLVEYCSKNGIKVPWDMEMVVSKILEMTDGSADLAKRVMMSSKEAINGKTLTELASHLNLPQVPSLGSMSNYNARVWYSWQKSLIKSKLDLAKPLEQQAMQACEMRNTIRRMARDAMQDQKLAKVLDAKELMKTFDQMVAEKTAAGFSGDALWNEIINSSMKGRGLVDELFKIPK